MRLLTAADISIILTAADIFPAAVQIQGFAPEDVYSNDAVELVETAMGVDGRLSAGYTPRPVAQRFMIQADSASVDFFEVVQGQQQANQTAYVLSGTIRVPATQKVYTMPKGFLTGYGSLPDAKKILQPRPFTITWEKVFASPSL